MKGDNRRAKKKQKRREMLFERKKKKMEQLQRDIGKFLGKDINDTILFKLGDKKAYSKIDQIRQKYSKGIQGKPYPV